MSFSYSVVAVGMAVPAVAAALERVTWRGTRVWSSSGAEALEEELEKREPPRAGFLEDDRDLSRSG